MSPPPMSRSVRERGVLQGVDDGAHSGLASGSSHEHATSGRIRFNDEEIDGLQSKGCDVKSMLKPFGQVRESAVIDASEPQVQFGQ